jgi:hypothetical protein
MNSHIQYLIKNIKKREKKIKKNKEKNNSILKKFSSLFN